MDELIESGTLLTLIEMLSLENPTEADKNSSIRVVYSISLYGLKYKEIICKVGSIRVICECLGTVRIFQESTDRQSIVVAVHNQFEKHYFLIGQKQKRKWLT